MNELLFFAEQNTDEAAHQPLNPLAPGEILLGTLSGISSDGLPQVSYLGIQSESAVVALATTPISQQLIGRQVALLFANGNLQKPIIIGIIHSPLSAMLENFSLLENIEVSPVADSSTSAAEIPADQDPFDGHAVVKTEASPLQTVRVDGKRIVIEGQEEIVLTCGESSITLTKAGKILIRGKYLVSRSSGVNRILGGSVQVN